MNHDIGNVTDLVALRVLRERTLEILDRLQDGSFYGPSWVLGFSEKIHRINTTQYNARLEAINRRIEEVTAVKSQP